MSVVGLPERLYLLGRGASLAAVSCGVASWLGLSSVSVTGRGDLGHALALALLRPTGAGQKVAGPSSSARRSAAASRSGWRVETSQYGVGSSSPTTST